MHQTLGNLFHVFYFILWEEVYLTLIYRWENWGFQSISNMLKLVGSKAWVWMDPYLALLRHQRQPCSVWFGTEVDSGFWLILTSHQNPASSPGPHHLWLLHDYVVEPECRWGLEFTECFPVYLETIALQLNSVLCLQALEIKGRFKGNCRRGGVESCAFSAI